MIHKRCPKVLFVTYGGGHYKLLSPIIKRISKSPSLEFRIIALTLAYERALSEFSYRVVRGFSSYKSLFESEKSLILEASAKCSDKSSQSLSIPQIESIYYLGLSYLELEQRHGKEKANQLYLQRGRQSFSQIKTMGAIIEFESPDLVVVTSSPRAEHAALLAAKERGIATLQILDLFGTVFPPPIADTIVVMNEFVRAQLIDAGVSPARVVALGQPALEETVMAVERIRRENLNLDSVHDHGNQKIVVVATEPPVEFAEDFSVKGPIEYDTAYGRLFEVLQDFAESHDNISVFLRCHPNESVEKYCVLLLKFPAIKFLPERYSLAETLAIADVVLVRGSTVGVEAALNGIPVITYRRSEEAIFNIPEYTVDPFLHVWGAENIASALDRALAEKPVQQTFTLQRNSKNQIASLIIEIARKARDKPP